MHHRAKGHGRKYITVGDDCKVFVGELSPTVKPDQIHAWLSYEGFELAIPCKVVIRGRTGIRRGLDALNRGGGPPPIKVAPPTGGLVPHIAFRNEGQIVSLQTRRGEPPSSSRSQYSKYDGPSYRFSTSSCPSGWGKTALSDAYVCQSVLLPPQEQRGHFRWGLDVGWSTKVPGCLVGRRVERAGRRPATDHGRAEAQGGEGEGARWACVGGCREGMPGRAGRACRAWAHGVRASGG